MNFLDKLAPLLTSGEGQGKQGKPSFSGWCPKHEDPQTSTKPSAEFLFDDQTYSSGAWFCFVCEPKGQETQLATAVEYIEKRGLKLAVGGNVRSLGKARIRKSRSTVKSVTTDVLDVWVDALWENEEMLTYLRERRGLTDDSIKRWNLGWSGQRKRIVMPVYDSRGDLVNARMYLPDANHDDTKIHWYVPKANGGKEPAFFGHQHYDKDDGELWLVEGEWDCILAHQYGLNALSVTRGAGKWVSSYDRVAKNRLVYISYDNDQGGQSGAVKVLRSLKISGNPHAIYVARYPEKDADLTDMVVDEGWDQKAIDSKLRADAEERWRRPNSDLPSSGPLVTLTTAKDARHHEKPVELYATVVGQVASYKSLYKFEVFCGQDKGKVCAVCPMGPQDKAGHIQEVKWPANNTKHLEYSIGSKVEQRRIVQADLGLKCYDKIEAVETKVMNVEKLIVSDSVEHTGDYSGQAALEALYTVGKYDSVENSTNRYIGMPTTDPKDRRAVIQAWSSERVDSELDSFEVTPELVESLKVFQPEQGVTPLQQMEKIAIDLESVTGIVGRTDLAIVYDIAWHSVLSFRFDGELQEHGWVEALVIGDGRTGKSDLAKGLQAHYRSGAVYPCDSASFAGLIGGNEKVGDGQWVMTWGAYPRNDRRLVILDEAGSLVGGKDRDIIPAMSSIRSTGIAEIIKIHSGKVNARVRAVWIANPISGKDLVSHKEGAVDAIAKMFPQREDIARFDLACSVARDEVPSSRINMPRSERGDMHEPKYDSTLCRNLVSWAWSRKPENVVWGTGVEKRLLAKARRMGKRYTSGIPLIQGENVRFKIARIAVAIAARTFSTDASGTQVIVQIRHVNDAVAILDRLYSTETFPYRESSERTVKRQERAKGNVGQWRKAFEGEWLVSGQWMANQDGVWKKDELRKHADYGIDVDNMTKELAADGLIVPKGIGYETSDALINLATDIERSPSE